ncbi:hypothetical protein VTL71DRAFT_7726 [Oculimacula yallundae]|uniref:Uncharacterized protein n=1 Tax=Oculimacula yallundae TaxID=86028 RepID=A0ABR4BUX8_9HELO
MEYYFPAVLLSSTMASPIEWSQSDIAKAACGRTDTCDGKEWNTLFEVVRMSDGPSEWSEIRSTGVFCTKGCWEGLNSYNAQCH